MRQIIQTTTDDLGAPGWDQEYGYGRINAGRALTPLYSLSLTDVLGQELTTPIPFLVDHDNTFLPLTSERKSLSVVEPTARTLSRAAGQKTEGSP